MLMKKFLLSMFFVLTATLGIQAQKVSLDFTSNTWGLPEASANKAVDAATFTSGDYSVILTGSTGNGYYFNTSGYLMLGKNGASLALPAFDFAVSKIEVVGRTGASTGTLENIYVGETAVSTQCKGSATTNSFQIAESHQAAGNVYVLKIESSHNAQITAINIYEAGSEPTEPEGGETPEEPETPSNDYLNETFATDLGLFTTQETVGNYPWAFAKNYGAKASGYANGASQDAESWLISPAMNLTGETKASIAFDYVINKGDANAAATNHKLLITNNYTGNVTTTEWTEVEYGAVNNGNWTFNNTGNIALPESMMDKPAVVIAFKYVSTTENSSTWEIKNVVVSGEKGATVEPEEPEVPTETQNYTVTEALAAYVDGQQIPAIVTGYIVGAVNNAPETGSQFGADATIDTNILISDNPDTNDHTECLIVQLPSGAIRTALNLVENPGNYKKQVKITGSVEKYFKVAGLKGVKAYEFTGTTGIDEVTENGVQCTVIYDLTGRRVEEITLPGIYIVNGKKQLVR